MIFDRLGRRGLVLALFGLAWVIQGIAVLVLGNPDVPGPWVHERLPEAAEAAAWIVPGLLGIGSSLRRRREDDSLGFLGVSLMPLFMATSFGVGFATALLSPNVPNGFALLGILGFSIWGVVSAALALIASWPEPPPTNGEGES